MTIALVEPTPRERVAALAAAHRQRFADGCYGSGSNYHHHSRVIRQETIRLEALGDRPAGAACPHP